MTGPTSKNGAQERPLWLELAGFTLWALLSAGLFATSLWMLTHDWEHGRARSAAIALCALAVFFARWRWAPLRAFRGRTIVGTAIFGIATIAALIGLAADVRIGLESIDHAKQTGEIRLDQGKNLLRAAQLVARGEDPYGRGALVDLEAYRTRFAARIDLGLVPQMQRYALPQALSRYAREPDLSLRKQLFPEPAPGGTPEQSAAAEREYRLLGHKYGPLPVLVALPFVYFLHAGPALIPALQLAVFLGWIAALIFLLRAPALRLGWIAVPLVLALVLLEPHVAHDYLFDSASDAWVLGFAALALGAFLRGQGALTGLAVALALGCKTFPAALFIPLIFARPMRRALLSFALVSAALYLPFFLWDPRGLWLNLVAWPSLMAPDNTGWLAYLPEAIGAIRPLLLLAIAALSATELFGLRVASARPFLRFVPVDPARSLAHFTLVSALAVLAGSAFHNNYVPWVTTWGFAALVAAFAARPLPARASAQSAQPQTNIR